MDLKKVPISPKLFKKIPFYAKTWNFTNEEPAKIHLTTIHQLKPNLKDLFRISTNFLNIYLLSFLIRFRDMHILRIPP